VKKTTQRGTLFFLLTKYFSGNEIERNEMGGACGTCGGQERSYRILVGDLRERDHLEDLGVDGKIILKWSFKRRDGEAWTGLIWLRIVEGVEPLCTRD